jgi:predicted lipoprotein with Yx(FWY)xxD motif
MRTRVQSITGAAVVLTVVTAFFPSCNTCRAASPHKLEHPGDVALSQADTGEWVYKSFPGLARLYVFDGDGRNASNCSNGCASAWPPLLATAKDVGEHVGDWLVIRRPDGGKQWAYKGHPVYLRFHDLEPEMIGAGIDGFHPLRP